MPHVLHKRAALSPMASQPLTQPAAPLGPHPLTLAFPAPPLTWCQEIPVRPSPKRMLSEGSQLIALPAAKDQRSGEYDDDYDDGAEDEL